MYKILKDGSIGEVRCKNSSSINIFLVNEAIRLIKESPNGFLQCKMEDLLMLIKLRNFPLQFLHYIYNNEN
jgi:hypothetical protein